MTGHDDRADASADDLEAMPDTLNTIEQQTSKLFGRTLLLWCFRWVIGFTIIGLVTWFSPDWSWLWWAGLAVAAASLIFTLAMQVLLQRRMAQARETSQRLEAVLADLDEDEN